MRYEAAALTDIGERSNNQDSLLIRHAATPRGEALMAVICDGMGGHSCGELASGAVVRAFDAWFERELPRLDTLDMRSAEGAWTELLVELNERIRAYGEANGKRLGATFSGLLLAGGRSMVVHVGDSRIYRAGLTFRQITKDQTLAARESARGAISREAAKTDSRRSVLMQSVGVTERLVPQVVHGRASHGVYLLCTDGLYHEVTDKELQTAMSPRQLQTKEQLESTAAQLIRLVQSRGERDNVSLMLIRSQGGREETGGPRDLDRVLCIHTEETI